MQHASESSVVHLIANFCENCSRYPIIKKQTAKSTKSCLLYVHSVSAYYCSWWQIWWFYVLALYMKWIEIIHILRVFLAKLVTDPFPKRSLLGCLRYIEPPTWTTNWHSLPLAWPETWLFPAQVSPQLHSWAQQTVCMSMSMMSKSLSGAPR